jgi:hypothetical protein
MDKNGYETDNEHDNFLMSGGNDLTMSGGNDLTMSGGGCSKPSDGNAYAGLEQLIDDPIIANELGSYKSLFDMFRVGEFEPPERLLGKYILETSTCTSIKKVMKKELTNKIVTHYNEKREDFEQYLKVKIQTYVDKNIPTELKKGYDDALVKAEEEKEKEKGKGTLHPSEQDKITALEKAEANNNLRKENKVIPNHKPPPPPIPMFDTKKLYKNHNNDIVKYKKQNNDGTYEFFNTTRKKESPIGYNINYSLAEASEFEEYNPDVNSKDNEKSNESFHQKFNSVVNNNDQLKLDADGITSDDNKLMSTYP